MVVQKPAPKAEVKWQGRSSAKEEEQVREVRTPHAITPEAERLSRWDLVILKRQRLQLGPLLRI